MCNIGQRHLPAQTENKTNKDMAPSGTLVAPNPIPI